MSIIWRERHPVSFALCPNWFEIKIHNSEINVWLKQPLNYWTKRTWEGSSCLRSKIRHGLFLETIKISVFKRSWVMKSPIIVSQVQLVCAEHLRSSRCRGRSYDTQLINSQLLIQGRGRPMGGSPRKVPWDHEATSCSFLAHVLWQLPHQQPHWQMQTWLLLLSFTSPHLKASISSEMTKERLPVKEKKELEN